MRNIERRRPRAATRPRSPEVHSFLDRAPTERYQVRAVQRALDILLCFTERESEVSVTELSNAVGLDPSTTYRLLVTLQSRGFVEQSPHSGKYRLGVNCLTLGSAYLKNNDLRQSALAPMNRLRDECGETVHLTILDGSEVVYIEKLSGLNPIVVMGSRVGKRNPAYCTGVGKAMLAFLPEDELKERFAGYKFTRFTPTTITSWGALKRELEEVRVRGYAIDREEHEPGVVCVACPIFDHKGMVASISVSGPAERMYEQIQSGVLIEKLSDAATEISLQMGGDYSSVISGRKRDKDSGFRPDHSSFSST